MGGAGGQGEEGKKERKGKGISDSPPRLAQSGAGLILGDALLDDIGADLDAFEAVGVIEIVFQVELVEGEGREEGGEVGRIVGVA